MTDEFAYSIEINTNGGNSGIVPKRSTAFSSEITARIYIRAALCACRFIDYCPKEIQPPILPGFYISPAAADSIDSDLILRARDGVLGATTLGAEIVDAFIFNSPEILQILILDRPDLLAEALSLLVMLQEPSRSLLDGDGSFLITQGLMNAVKNFVSTLGAAGSGELDQILQGNLSKLGPLDNYVGLPVKEAAAQAFDYTVSIEENPNATPGKFSLEHNYPNPFNPVTSVQFSVASEEFVSLKVYDVLGNEVATLVNERKLPGVYHVKFEAGNLPSGVYFVKMSAGGYTSVDKMLLMK